MTSGYRYLFGPVPSRRFGRSLGIDLTPFKTCSLDCIFCQLGRTTRLTTERAEWVDGAKQVSGQLIDAAGFEKLFRLDDWNEVRIVAEGRRLRHFMNGTQILDFTDAEDLALREGVLALQLHAGVPMWAEFKDIAVRELAPAD